MASSFFRLFRQKKWRPLLRLTVREGSANDTPGSCKHKPKGFSYININNLLSPTDFRSVESQ